MSKRRKRSDGQDRIIRRDAVLMGVWALELHEAGYGPEAIRREVVRRLREMALAVERGEVRGIAAARLLLDDCAPQGGVAAQRLRQLANHVEGVTRHTWHERLQGMLEP